LPFCLLQLTCTHASEMNHNKHYADLSKNILLFSQALRERKVMVTTDNVLDALKGTSFINLERKEDFYDLLKSNFVSRREEMAPFDRLFDQFWSFEDAAPPAPKEIPGRKSETSEDKEDGKSSESEKKETSLFKDWAEETEKERPTEEKEIPGYSPDEILGRKDFSHLKVEELEKVKDIVIALARKMALTLSRRWQKGKSGDRIDFRRSIRQSLKYGGDLVELKMKEPKPRPYHVILVGDVSGSMDIYSQFFLLWMYGLQNYYAHCETFVFSTRLSRITTLLKRRPFPEALRLLSQRTSDWSGGTDIGGALHHLHQHYSDLLVARRTVLMIFSDGWDRGDTRMLDAEMKNLKRQTRRLIWLNPLLGGSNYQPLCKGMSTALPYLDHFLPCHNFVSLKNLAHLLLKS